MDVITEIFAATLALLLGGSAGGAVVAKRKGVPLLRVFTLVAEVPRLQAAQADAEGRIEKVVKHGEWLENQLNTVRELVDSKDAYIAELEEQKAALKEHIAALMAERDVINAQNVALAAEKARLEAAIRDLEGRLSRLEVELARLRTGGSN